MSRIKYLALRFLVLLAVLPACFSKQAMADADWSTFMSETKLYSVLMPGQPDEHIEAFRIGEDQVIYTSEAVSFIDQRPYKNIIKNYVIKFEQTIGLGMKPKDRVGTINKELDVYLQSYQDKNPTVLNREIFHAGTGHYTFGELSLFYANDDDSDVPSEGIRVKIYLTNTTKFYQIFSGPEKDLHSKITNRFFNSFDAKSGVVQKVGTLNKDWNKIESPLSLFSIKVPPLAPPYFQTEPTVTQESSDREQVGMVFFDPVRKHKLFYNITGYQLDAEMSFELVETALKEDFMKKHGRTLAGIELNKNFNGDIPYIESAYDIRPPKRFPYATKARVRALFLGNYMMVQEVIGPPNLVQSQLTEGFFNLVEFTPKKAFKKNSEKIEQEEKAKEEMQKEVSSE